MQNRELSLELLAQLEEKREDEAIESEVAYKKWLIEERKRAIRALRMAFGSSDPKVDQVISKMRMWIRDDMHEL